MLIRAAQPATLEARIAAALRARTPAARGFFAAYAPAIARAARDVAARLASGGSVYAFGRGAYATDAQHSAVEFVHPVLVGKPALPATDLSASFEAALPVVARAGDVAIGYGPPGGDPAVARALAAACERGLFTIALPGTGSFGVEAPGPDDHVHQELIEILGHMLYESVHVFLERRQLDRDAGAASFLYPFLGHRPQADALDDVVASLREKAADAEALRERVAAEEAGAIAAAVATLADALRRGGRIVAFGNGGSATDASDLVFDCVQPPPGLRPVPALSLAADPATITAIANDVGREAIFLRQLIAHARPHDALVALSTSGGSRNVIEALAEARKRGLRTIALLGYDGGAIAREGLADCAIVVRSGYVPRVQEAQAAIYHTMRHALAWAAAD